MVAVDLGQFVLVAVTEGKPHNRAGARWKCTPSAYGISPGGGDFSDAMR